MSVDTQAWSDYFVAQAGAAAALAGLLFVAVSINLARVLEYPNLPGRAAETLILLVGLLTVALVGLVPGQAAGVLGVELAVVGAIALLAIARIQWRSPKSRYEPRVMRSLLALTPAVSWLVAGICLWSSAFEWGFSLNLAASVLTLLSVAYSTWVLLVEIQR
ncbi:MAG TPA: hypothetical protein VHM70_16345 [Polyangiaceae bacterium]|jgi:modulator of FtsH protease|nr:hypothetical protein [Polyangiaceae bacterium]